MTRRARDQRDVGLAFHLDDLVDGLEARPAVGRLVLRAVVGLDALEVEVLHIGAGIGEAPCDMLVLAEDHAGQRRHRRAGHLQLRCLDAREVPQRRRAQLQVRVVGEQRLAALGVRAVHNPVVRADAFDAGLGREIQGLRTELAVDSQLAEQRRVVGGGKRLLARVWRQQLVDALDRQSQRKPHAQQLGAPIGAEVPRHHDSPGQRVFGRPWLGLQAEHDELGRARLHRAAQVGIDASRVGADDRLRLRARTRPLHAGRALDAERTQELVVVERRRAEGLGQAARADAPMRLELPQAVLRMHEAEAEHRVLARLRLDGRDAGGVALDADLVAQADEAQAAVGLRH